MRFGRTLQLSVYPPWRDNYIDYAKLKKLLREDEPAADHQAAWTEDDESAFVDELVNVQLEKVHTFHRDIYEKLRERTARCEGQLDVVAVADRHTENVEHAAGSGESSTSKEKGAGLFKDNEGQDNGGNSNANGKKPVPSEQEKQRIMKEALSELDSITKETNELEKYSRINYTGFLKAAKKHDRKRGSSYRVRPLLQVRLAALPFNKEDYSPLLYRISAMYSFMRQHMEGGDERRISLVEMKPANEDYISHKFWVHPENLLELKTIILRRLPVLVYNPQTSKVAEASKPDPTVTSLYFDTPNFSLYTNKVDHGEAMSLRLRWYGQLNSKPEIWVEKKVVKHDDTSRESRITIKEKYVQSFVKGEYGMEKQIKKLEDRAGSQSVEVQTFKSSVEEIQAFIKEKGLQPVVRANYNRTAFQIPGDDRVRISLDNDLAFIREDAIDINRPCRDPDNWHRTDIDDHELEFPFNSIRKGEISRFPFAVLEIKIRNDGKKSEWIQEIMDLHLVKEAPRFSKFVHGVAELFEDYVNTFPFWLSEMETDIRRDPHQAFADEQAKRQKEIEDEFAVGSLMKSTPSIAPMRRTEGLGVVSPVGSPEVTAAKSPYSEQMSKHPTFGNIASAEPTQLNETAEEPDDDETGQHAPITEARSGGFGTFIQSFGTSDHTRSHRGRKPLPPGVSKPEYWLKDQGPLKVEGKVWLANQRTFIKWQHVSILLASLSLGLFNAAGEENNIARALAGVYTLIAIFTGAWGYGIYMWRTRLIERRSGKDFDAVAGPMVVCVALIIALLLNFTFKYRAAMEERNSDSLELLMNNSTQSSFIVEDL